jgi:hypothetical protein
MVQEKAAEPLEKFSAVTIAEGQAAGLVVEGNPERLAWVEFCVREGLVGETKRCSVKTTITTALTKNRLVPKL